MPTRKSPRSKNKTVVHSDDKDVNGVVYPKYLLDTTNGAYNLKIARNAYDKGISDLFKCQFCIDKNVECVFLAGQAMRRCALCKAEGRPITECDGTIFKPASPRKRFAEGLSNEKGKKPKFDSGSPHSNQGFFSYKPHEVKPFSAEMEATPSTPSPPTPQSLLSPQSLKKSQQLLVGIELGSRISTVQTEISEKVRTMTDQAQSQFSHAQKDINDLRHQIEKIHKAMAKQQKQLAKIKALLNRIVEKTDSSSSS